MKILVVRFSSIGDIVLTSPVVRCLKKQLGAEIHFLTKPAFAGMLEANPYIDKVFSWPKNPGELISSLKKEKYDHVVDLHHNLRSLRIKLALGRPSTSFNKLNFEKWLLVKFSINKLPKIHIVDRYMETVKGLGAHYDGQGLDFFIPETSRFDLSVLGEALLPYRFVAFVIGATHPTKRLPEHKIISICNNITDSVVLLGGKSESASADYIKAHCKHNVYNAVGKTDLFQSASIVAQSGCVITHDTGLMHIAAALDKQIVSVWGNTVPEFGMYPLYREGKDKNTSIQNKELSCRPCSKIGHQKCPKGHFKCMEDIDIGQITAAIHVKNGGY